MSKEKTTIGAEPIYDATKLGTSKMIILGIQHMFAMFGATILVPALTGLSVSATLLFAGLGTLLFHLITKRKVPAFLGSSFAFIGGYASVAPMIDGQPNKEMLPYACFGLSLSQSAINSCSANWWIAMVAIVVIVVCNIWGKGMVKIIPIILGVISSYVVAAVCTAAGLITVENGGVDFQNPDWALLATAAITIIPISLATIVEHIGDISAISSTVGRNYIKDPGLHRTLLGDGLATMLAALFGAPANTTYGENTGVLSLTKVYDPRVIRLAALFSMIFSFSPKIAAIIGCMPGATTGGVSLVLYGMISAVGVRNVVENQVDFSKSRNVIIAALILVLSIGITYSAAGAISFHVGGANVSLSGLAVGSLVGILLNAILPGKDYVFADDEPKDTGVNFEV